MTITPFTALSCPLDGHPLTPEGMTWRCVSGHSFDIAREGYTYLLPVQKKRSLDPGDSKEMVAARRRFLNAGHYQFIADAVSQAALAGFAEDAQISCLDAGCGEGYYLRQLAKALQPSQSLAVLGLDISKWAIQSAAKQDKSATCGWVVGSNANLPVPAKTIDRLLCLFGFPVYAEFARVLKADGQVLQVDAGPNHLRELREIIYPVLKPERLTEPSVPQGFTRLYSETLSHQLSLEGAEQIADLLAMTPHLYRATAEGRAKAAALTALSITLEVRLTCLALDPAYIG